MNGIYILTGILGAAAVLLSGICLRMRKKLEMTRRLRIGYERKYNTFKLKYTFLSKLENERRVIENAAKIPQPFYVYGGGVVGDKFMKVLKAGNIEVERVIEGRELEENPEYGTALDSEKYVIITPMFDYVKISSLLQQYFAEDKIIGLDEIIN